MQYYLCKKFLIIQIISDIRKIMNPNNKDITTTNTDPLNLFNLFDLYLMHWPFAFAQKDLSAIGPFRDERGTPNPKLTIKQEYLDTWRSLARVKADGFAKNIGVSNFTEAQISDVIALGLGAPAVNQVELHPYLQQPALTAFCRKHNITMMAYSPLGSSDSYSGTSFPADVERPIINLLVARNQAISLVLWGEAGEKSLREQAETIRDELTSLPQVTNVKVQGLRPLQTTVEITREHLMKTSPRSASCQPKPGLCV